MSRGGQCWIVLLRMGGRRWIDDQVVIVVSLNAVVVLYMVAVHPGRECDWMVVWTYLR